MIANYITTIYPPFIINRLSDLLLIVLLEDLKHARPLGQGSLNQPLGNYQLPVPSRMLLEEPFIVVVVVVVVRQKWIMMESRT
jgi:hypothetical protein